MRIGGFRLPVHESVCALHVPDEPAQRILRPLALQHEKLKAPPPSRGAGALKPLGDPSMHYYPLLHHAIAQLHTRHVHTSGPTAQIQFHLLLERALKHHATCRIHKG